MTISEDRLIDAQQSIARTLQDLEAKTCSYVEAVEVDEIDVTQIHDSKIRLVRSVRIKLRSRPGRGWDTGLPG